MDIIHRLQGVEFDPFYQTGDASADDEQRDFIIGYTFAQRL